MPKVKNIPLHSSGAKPWKPTVAIRAVGDMSDFTSNNDLLTHFNDHLPIVSKWLKPSMDSQKFTLETGYKINEFKLSPHQKNQGLLHILDKKTCEFKEVDVYQKLIHIMSPYEWMKHGKRITNLINFSDAFWKYYAQTNSFPESMAYVDAAASIFMNQLAVEKKSPHVVKCYGAHRAVCKEYQYNLEDDFDTFRFTKWFWQNLELGWFNLKIVEKSTGRCLSKEEIYTLFKPDDEFIRDSESDLESDSDSGSELTSDTNADNITEDETLSSDKNSESETKDPDMNPVLDEFCEIDMNSIKSYDNDKTPVEIHRGKYTRHTQQNNEDDDGNTLESDLSFSDEYEVYAVLENMPVVVLYYEKMVDALDKLLDDTELVGAEHDTDEWFKIWSAWVFQICAGLTQIQLWLNLTHNDLHTNNIVWKPTSEEFLYYKNKSGCIWKVPTYGKIFQIIDYGRAIFTIDNKLIISGDHYDGGDAASQYNFGIIQDKSLPYVPPNRSFDLCRLACGLIHGIFPTFPAQKEMGSILTKEDDWIFFETINPLFNLLWTWTRDDNGETIFIDKDGEEKYPGFDLYSIISSSVHGAIPEKQLDSYLLKQYIDKISIKMANIQYIELPF